MVQMFNSWPLALAVALVAGLPGVGEELWCRAFLGRGLVARHGPVLGVLFTSFFFGAIHIHPVQGAVAMCLGIWLHFAYLTTRSLWVPILLHFLNNAFAVTVTRFEQLRDLEEAPGGMPRYVYLAAALLLLAVGAALYQSRARIVGEDGGPSPWQPDQAGVEWPPPGSGARVAHPWPSLGLAVLVVVIFAGFVAACVVGLNR
jgi:hypothetical protein